MLTACSLSHSFISMKPFDYKTDLQTCSRKGWLPYLAGTSCWHEHLHDLVMHCTSIVTCMYGDLMAHTILACSGTCTDPFCYRSNAFFHFCFHTVAYCLAFDRNAHLKDLHATMTDKCCQCRRGSHRVLSWCSYHISVLSAFIFIIPALYLCFLYSLLLHLYQEFSSFVQLPLYSSPHFKGQRSTNWS